MKAHDFSYDNIKLSDLGMTLCHFDSLGVETISMGSEISFNTISMQHGARHELISSSFDDGLTFTLQICKNLCDDSNMKIDLEMARDIMRWLSRKEYHVFKLIDYDGEYSGIYFNAAFNVSKIEVNGDIVGFQLDGFTNAPYGYAEDVIVNINAEAGEIISIYNKSDDEGYVYPSNMEITVKEDGSLKITNHRENRDTIIKNCSVDETIVMNYPMIFSSLGDERETKIANDFNWIFPRLASTFKDRLNLIETSLPCSIKITYKPVVKVGI